jgi:hypothetical protein
MVQGTGDVMAKWVLILYFSWNGDAIEKVEGFSSQEACLAAAEHVAKIADGRYLRVASCIEVR